MNQKELKELIEFLIEKDIAEFELERGDVKVRIKRGGADSAEPRYIAVPPVQPNPAFAPPAVPAAHPAPGSPTAAPPAGTAESEEEAGLHVIRSPIVGTFYEAA